MSTEDLRLLIDQRDIDGVDDFIKNGGNVNKVFINGMTPLLHTIRMRGQLETDEKDVSVDDNRFSFREAIVSRLLTAGADVQAREPVGNMTPLLLALFLSRSERIVILLINAGSDIDAESNMCLTPLLLAVRGNYSKTLICRLIQMGADVNHREYNGLTSLCYAVFLNDVDKFEVITTLINAGADVNVCKKGEKSSLIIEVLNLHTCCSIDDCKYKQIVNVLVSYNFNLKNRDIGGRTLIHLSNCNYIISLCIRAGVSVNSLDKLGMTPLTMAIFSDNIGKVNNLLSLFKVDPNYVSHSNLITPLHTAAVKSNIGDMSEIISLLVYYGGNLLARCANNETPLDSAVAQTMQLSSFYYVFKNFVNAVIQHVLLFMDERQVNDCVSRICTDNVSKAYVASAVNRCKEELRKMSDTLLTDSLTFHEFCCLKKVFNSKFINICASEYKFNYDQIKNLFPIYHNLIILRIKDNHRESIERFLRKNLENIIVSPLKIRSKADLNVQLGYDCLYLIGSYLNYKQLNNLFLASIEN